MVPYGCVGALALEKRLLTARAPVGDRAQKSRCESDETAMQSSRCYYPCRRGVRPNHSRSAAAKRLKSLRDDDQTGSRFRTGRGGQFITNRTSRAKNRVTASTSYFHEKNI
jgi:hypothetical protein